MTKPVEIVTLTAEQLDERIVRAVTIALHMERERGAAGDEVLSLREASRRARRRTADVSAALTSGALRGRRVGKRWRIRRADVDAWAAGESQVDSRRTMYGDR